MLRLVGQLPQASRFHGAVANDPEHVEAILEATGGQQPEYHPPLAEWRTENDQLASAVEKLDTLIAVMVKANGGNPGKQKPMPRPQTAFAEARLKRAKSQHKKLVARVIRKQEPAPAPVD
jgi:hypothetical protein